MLLEMTTVATHYHLSCRKQLISFLLRLPMHSLTPLKGSMLSLKTRAASLFFCSHDAKEDSMTLSNFVLERI